MSIASPDRMATGKSMDLDEFDFGDNCYKQLIVWNPEADEIIGRTIYYSSKWLWFFALLFHYCFLLVFIRHFRFFMDPVPGWLTFMESIDGIMQIGAPRFFWTGGLLLVAVLFLLARRLFNQRLRYISLMNDYFPLQYFLYFLITKPLASHFP